MTNHNRLTPEDAFDQWIASLDEESTDSDSFAEDAFHAGWSYGFDDATEYYGTGGSFK